MKTVNPTNIPQHLKGLPIWCCWRYETDKGRETKVPYNPITRRKAKTNRPNTFTTFDTAVSATGYDGIGIRVAENIKGIDLDHCIEDGVLLPWAQEIVDKFHATYIEISPSGEGIRIFCLTSEQFAYDTATYYIKNGNIEVYIPGHTNRFLTVTGNVLNAAGVTETTEALTWLLDTHMRRPTPPTPAVASPGKSYLSDEEIIAKACAAKNGDKFSKLWHGDLDTLGYKSQSEADSALVAELAFWCSGDAEQMDSLFRQSRLMREKWDEHRGTDTYGNMTIAKVISRMTTFYKPNRMNITIIPYFFTRQEKS